MNEGALVRVIHPWSTHADGGDGGFWGMKDGREFFIKSGALGTVLENGGFRILVTFGDRTCWLDELSLEVLNEAG